MLPKTIGKAIVRLTVSRHTHEMMLGQAQRRGVPFSTIYQEAADLYLKLQRRLAFERGENGNKCRTPGCKHHAQARPVRNPYCKECEKKMGALAAKEAK